MSRVFRRDSASWSFTQHPYKADNDCMIQQELAFHSIIFVAVSTGYCQSFHYSLLTTYCFQIPQNFLFSLMFFSRVYSMHVGTKILQVDSNWYFLIKKLPAISIRRIPLWCKSPTGYREYPSSHGVPHPPLTLVFPLFLTVFVLTSATVLSEGLSCDPFLENNGEMEALY